jgi:hypothetical protein
MERVLLGKPAVAQLLKNFPACYGIRRFIDTFKRVCQWSLSWARWIQQSLPPHPVFPRSTILSSWHAWIFFPLAFRPKPSMHSAPPTSRACCTMFQSHPPWLDHSNYMRRGVQVMKLLVMEIYPASYYLIPLGSKYSPQHLVLRYPQPLFFP